MAAEPAPAPDPDATIPPHGFTPLDWGLLAGVALTWGSSFMFIDIGVDHFDPGLVAFLRILFGAVTLAVIPAARRSVRREDLPLIALLGVIWMAVPFVLFPYAQERIDSSLAGMINAGAPLFAAVIAAGIARALPSGARIAGLLVGFAGVVAITASEVGGASASVLGVLLVLLATVLYGFSFNLTGPLQQRNGALPVIWRAQLVALVIDLPIGVAAVPGSEFAWDSLLSCVVLGAGGTAFAYVWFSVLVGRVGTTPASITLYFVPVVAIILGAAVRDETITLTAILGTGLVIAGAYVVSRSR